MSTWTTITIESAEFARPSDYTRAATESLDATDYRRAELDDAYGIIVLKTPENTDSVLESLFSEYGNRFLCPNVLTIRAEDTGDSRTARLLRPPEQGEPDLLNPTWEAVAEYEWIDRDDEGTPGIGDDEMADRIEEEFDIPTNIRYRF